MPLGKLKALLPDKAGVNWGRLGPSHITNYKQDNNITLSGTKNVPYVFLPHLNILSQLFIAIKLFTADKVMKRHNILLCHKILFPQLSSVDQLNFNNNKHDKLRRSPGLSCKIMGTGETQGLLLCLRPS